jgi:hypothetical protein
MCEGNEGETGQEDMNMDLKKKRRRRAGEFV